MKVVSMFQTADGKTFTNREDAKRHETECEAMDKLRALLAASINSAMVRQGNIDNVLKQMLLESVEVRNILLSYGKKTPKPTEAAA